MEQIVIKPYISGILIKSLFLTENPPNNIKRKQNRPINTSMPRSDKYDTR